jgi:hypothetical protein
LGRLIAPLGRVIWPPPVAEKLASLAAGAGVVAL